MAGKKVSIDGLAGEVMKGLREYGQGVADGLKEAVQDAAELCQEELRATSPKLTGDYAKGWRKRTVKESSTKVTVSVYNATDPQLTHLLEHGHAGPSELTTAFGQSGPTWSRELATLSKRGFAVKQGQKYYLTELGASWARTH